MNDNIIDIKSLIDSKNRSCKSWEKHNFLFKKLSKVILSKLNELKSNYERYFTVVCRCDESY